MADQMTDEAGLRMMQRTEEARGCHHLSKALQAGADAILALTAAQERIRDLEETQAQREAEAVKFGVSMAVDAQRLTITPETAVAAYQSVREAHANRQEGLLNG